LVGLGLEPTSALDPDTIAKVEDTLKSRTCLWITHDPEQQQRVATSTLEMKKPNRYRDDDDDNDHTIDMQH
jgi:ABC-type phosphate transport system ATPase subunit